MKPDTELTIHFENAREASDLTGHGNSILGPVGDTLNVRLTARDTWLKVHGQEIPVQAAGRFFETLRKVRNSGKPLKPHHVLFAAGAFREGREQELDRLHDCFIEVEPGRSRIFPQTFGQLSYVELIRNNDLVFGIGPAGTGKTFLAMAMAVNALTKGLVSRIVLTRPAIEAGEALGFLPGDMHQKVLPYLRPLYDALYVMMNGEEIDRNISRGIIEVAPLAYMRGRTLNNAFVILDEAQNTTAEQMLMFLTRMGFDTKCVVTGDMTQIDLPQRKMSGLIEARRVLRDIKGIAFHELRECDVVRHPLVQSIVRAYREARESVTESAPPAKPAQGEG